MSFQPQVCGTPRPPPTPQQPEVWVLGSRAAVWLHSLLVFPSCLRGAGSAGRGGHMSRGLELLPCLPCGEQGWNRLMLCADKERAKARCPHPCQGRALSCADAPHLAPSNLRQALEKRRWGAREAGPDMVCRAVGRRWRNISGQMHSSGTTSTACRAEGSGVCAKGYAI